MFVGVVVVVVVVVVLFFGRVRLCFLLFLLYGISPLGD